MHSFEAECFEEYINKNYISVKNSGVLHYPIKSFSIKRDSDLNIIFTSISEFNSTSNSKNIPVGTVYTNKNQVILTDAFSNVDFILDGVSPYSQVTKDDKVELSSIRSVEAILIDNEKEKYLIEWVLNMDYSYFFYPDKIERTIKNETSINIGNINFNSIFTSRGKSRNCIHLKIDDFEVYLCKAEKQEKGGAFILYNKSITEETRRKIRDCLSFAIGLPLIYLGYSTFTEDSRLVSFKAISGYDFNGAFNLSIQPPTIYHENRLNEIDSGIFSRLITSLYKSYDLYNLQHILWMYWHASCSPSHSTAVQLGACIESLQKSYFDNANNKLNKKIIQDKVEWKKFNASTLKIINNLNIKDEEKKY